MFFVDRHTGESIEDGKGADARFMVTRDIIFESVLAGECIVHDSKKGVRVEFVSHDGDSSLIPVGHKDWWVFCKKLRKKEAKEEVSSGGDGAGLKGNGRME